MDNQVNFVLDIRGFFAHLYVPRLVFVVAPDFLQATPFEILTAASAGTATMTPPATMSATDNDAILRSMEKPLVGIMPILATGCSKEAGNPPRIGRYDYYLRCFAFRFMPIFRTIDRGRV